MTHGMVIFISLIAWVVLFFSGIVLSMNDGWPTAKWVFLAALIAAIILVAAVTSETPGEY